jgi:hypothetical protein
MEDDEAKGWASLAKRMKGASAPSAAAAASMEDEQARGDKQHSARTPTPSEPELLEVTPSTSLQPVRRHCCA